MSDFISGLADEGTAFDEVMDIVTQWDTLVTEIETTEDHLKMLQEQVDRMRLKVIPELLLKNGIDHIDLKNGRQIGVEEKLYISMPKDEEKKREVIDFLWRNGAGDMVKDKTTILDAPDSIKEVLQKQAIPFENTLDVNTNSFIAWSKRVLGMTKGSVQRIAVSDFPKAANLYIRREAKIK